MENSGKTRSSILSSILPFLISGCLVSPVVVHGLCAGETGNYWFILLPGWSICTFVWAKVASMAIIGYWRCGASRLKRPDANDLDAIWYREQLAKWQRIGILTFILTFIAMMIGVMIFPTRTEYRQRRQKSATKASRAVEPSGKTRRVNAEVTEGIAYSEVKNVQGFLEGTEVHRRLRGRDRLFRRLIPLPFLALLFGVVFLIRSLVGKWWKSGRKTPLGWKIFGIFAVVCFVGPIQVSFMVGGLIEETLRTEVIMFARNISPEAKVMVNGRVVRNSQDVISEVAKLTEVAAHHSHPTIRIRVDVIDEDRRLSLELGRDSELPREYWVFCPDYRFTKMNEIGRITTDIFTD